MQSHEHGYGKFRRWTWGAKEDCQQCKKEAPLRAAQARLMEKAREDFKNIGPCANCGEVECVCVPEPTIFFPADEEEDRKVNEIIAKDERPSFQPSTAELAMFLIFFFLCLGLSLHTVMRGDLAAVRFHQEAK